MSFPVPSSFVDVSSINDTEEILLSILEKNKITNKEIPQVGNLNISVKTACCYIDKKYNIKKLTQYIEKLIKDCNTIKSNGKPKHPKTPIQSINYTKNLDEDDGILVKNSKANNNFYNSICISVAVRENKNINLMIFTNGCITCTGSKNDDDGLIAVNHLLTQMKNYPDIFENPEDASIVSVINYDIVMINSNFFVGFLIDNHKLYNILITQRNTYNLFCSYDPRTYQGVKIYYMWNSNQTNKNGVCICTKKKCKFSAKKKTGYGQGECRRISVAIFGTGKVLIAGAKNNTQLYDTYNFIVKILQENYQDIVQYSVEDKKNMLKDKFNKGGILRKLKILV